MFASGRLDRVVDDPYSFLVAYRSDSGTDYLDFEPNTPIDVLVPEDLAVTVLINSRFDMRAFLAVQDRARELNLESVPATPLDDSSPKDRDHIAAVIAQMAKWPGFAASVATRFFTRSGQRVFPSSIIKRSLVRI